MSLTTTIRLECDAKDCEELATYEGRGDDPRHLAAAAGWRFTATGRALCEPHARREWPGSFVRRGHEFPELKDEPTDEDLLS